jgi:HSP20 family protein
MRVRWRQVTARSVRHVSTTGWPPWDLLAAVAWRPIVVPTGWRPATDVCETPESISVTAELAGVQEDDLEIELHPDALVIDGARRPHPCGDDAVYLVAQIRDGPFHLEVPLAAPVDADRTIATFENGILRVTLLKRQTAPTAVDIETQDR